MDNKCSVSFGGKIQNLAALQQIILAESIMGHGEENVRFPFYTCIRLFFFKIDHVEWVKGKPRGEKIQNQNPLYVE